MTTILKKQLFNIRTAVIVLAVLPLAAFLMAAPALSLGIAILFLFVLFSGLAAVIIYYRLKALNIEAELLLREQDYLEQANLIEADIEKEWSGIASLRKKRINYAQLKSFIERLNQSFTLKETSHVLSQEVSRIFGLRNTTVILYIFHSKTGELGLSSSQKGEMEINLKAKQGDVYDQWVAKKMQPLLIEDAKADYRFDMDKIRSEDARRIRSLMSAPLMIGNKAIGILRMDSPRPTHFTTEQLRLLMTIADLGAVAIENAQLYERIQQLAIRDSLTGLFLRRHFLERLSYELGRELRSGSELSLLMIDLDHFKKYNDTYGHMAGDIVLKTVAMILTDVFHEPGDIVCRYGGEEFAVLLPNRNKENALRLAEEFRKRVAQQPILLRRKKTRVTTSVGLATAPHDAQIKDEFIDAADRALYRAKKAGRNRVCTAEKI
ncbi:MAG: diguanylate cyclase [Candidatus Omnitrophota bacterium]